ncbi:ArsC family reductase [Neptunomonas antarctica]|uniref:Transcriptional regulator, Spx/MgsR family n=1 Tax=Neptunomonas antarctica TaxID=619304 RepID=A0A1N7PAJ7_9GAMM|nr:ArsC family reductase [Neptunomonas antarctica]SIT07614.1 transcriptional regulator, Spx/MgsR family [Neptunomonas antarctica]
MSITLFGIKNCDTIKKARKWLEAHQVEYRFHDFRVDGLSEALLDQWISALGWEVLLNKRSTSWRQLPESVKENIDAASARAVMLENPAIIKRPVLELCCAESETLRRVGFIETEYNKLFSNLTS